MMTPDDDGNPDAIHDAILDETAALGGSFNPMVVFDDTNLTPLWTLALDVLAERLSPRPREAYIRALKKAYGI
jgi:hypothetical protein